MGAKPFSHVAGHPMAGKQPAGLFARTCKEGEHGPRRNPTTVATFGYKKPVGFVIETQGLCSALYHSSKPGKTRQGPFVSSTPSFFQEYDSRQVCSLYSQLNSLVARAVSNAFCSLGFNTHNISIFMAFDYVLDI